MFGVCVRVCCNREFELRLPRTEVEEVEQLREKWQDLLDLAEDVRIVLLKEKRGAFEQELDKQVKVGYYDHQGLILLSKKILKKYILNIAEQDKLYILIFVLMSEV